MQEKRKTVRNSPFYYLRVFDTSNHQLGGRIVNMTPEGMTLIGEDPIMEETLFKFRMTLPETIADRKQMTVAAKSVWCREDKEPGCFRVGFQFLDLSPRNLETICQLCKSPR